MATPRVAAGALFFDEDGNVLLVKPTYKEGWDIPGGYVEPGESPRAACRREIREELALDLEIGRLLVVDWAPDSQGDKILFVFDGGELHRDDADRIELPREELSAVSFHNVADLGEVLIDRLCRRIINAASARRDEVFAYLENGTR